MAFQPYTRLDEANRAMAQAIKDIAEAENLRKENESLRKAGAKPAKSAASLNSAELNAFLDNRLFTDEDRERLRASVAALREARKKAASDYAEMVDTIATFAALAGSATGD